MAFWSKTKKPEQSERAKSRVIVIESAPAGLVLHGTYVSHEEIYRTSPSVRACVDWVARNVAQYHLETHMVDALGERPLERDRLRALFNDPAPGVSRFQLLEHLTLGMLLSGNSYAPLLTDSEGTVKGITPTGATVALRREQSGPPLSYELQTGLAKPVVVKPADMLHVRASTTTDPFIGRSPLEAMQGLIAEERASIAAREQMWRRGLRRDGVIEQDQYASRMSDEALESFMIDASDALSGDTPGRPFVLIPGMKWKDAAFSPEEAQYNEARSLTLRLVAGILGIPPQIVGAEARNTRTAYREIEVALSPWVSRVESAINAQLVPRLYGDQAAGGRIRARLVIPAPVTDNELGQTLDGAARNGRLTANETRAIVGLPPITGGDMLYPPPGSVPGGGGAA